MKHRPSLVGLAVGACVTPVAMLFAIASVDGGHGDYVVAKALFPFTILSTAKNGAITSPFILLALLQFPVYGWFMAQGIVSTTRSWRLWIPIAVHVIAVGLNFLLPNPGFSR